MAPWVNILFTRLRLKHFSSLSQSHSVGLTAFGSLGSVVKYQTIQVAETANKASRMGIRAMSQRSASRPGSLWFGKLTRRGCSSCNSRLPYQRVRGSTGSP